MAMRLPIRTTHYGACSPAAPDVMPSASQHSRGCRNRRSRNRHVTTVARYRLGRAAPAHLPQCKTARSSPKAWCTARNCSPERTSTRSLACSSGLGMGVGMVGGMGGGNRGEAVWLGWGEGQVVSTGMTENWAAPMDAVDELWVPSHGSGLAGSSANGILGGLWDPPPMGSSAAYGILRQWDPRRPMGSSAYGILGGLWDPPPAPLLP